MNVSLERDAFKLRKKLLLLNLEFSFSLTWPAWLRESNFTNRNGYSLMMSGNVNSYKVCRWFGDGLKVCHYPVVIIPDKPRVSRLCSKSSQSAYIYFILQVFHFAIIFSYSCCISNKSSRFLGFGSWQLSQFLFCVFFFSKKSDELVHI